MKIAREKEEAAKEAKATKRLHAAKRISDIEKQIQKDEIDKTPHPALPHTRSQTRQSTACDPLLMVGSSNGLRPASDSLPADKYQPSCSDSNADNMLSAVETADEDIEETPVKKKARTDKPSFRDTVKEIGERDAQAVVHDANMKLHRTSVTDLAGSCDTNAFSNK